MRRSWPRGTALLDACAALGLGGAAAQAAYGLGDRPVGMIAGAIAAVAACAALWVLWRRLRRWRLAIDLAFAACAIAIMLLGDGPLAFGSVWVACTMLALDLGMLAPLAFAGLLVAIATVLHAAIGSPWHVVLREGVSTLVFAGLAAVLAAVIHERDEAVRERARLDGEREAALDRLALANAELQRSLGSEHDLVVVEERERTARELHDVLGHRLAAIGLSLEFAGRMRERDPVRAHEEVVRAREQVAEALDAMRRIVRAMHPVELRAARGPEAFLGIAEGFRSAGLDVRVEADVDGELTHEQSLLLVRFVQEGLTNVVRHGISTRTVDVRVRAGEGRIAAAVEDHGLAAHGGADGFGLRSLRARARAAHGALEARPTDDGFVLSLTLPAEREAAA